MRKRFVSVFLVFIITAVTVFSPFSTASATFTPDQEINSQAAYLVNMDSGEVLYAKNEGQQIIPASLTKIMTAIIVLEEEDDLNRIITAPSYVFDEFVGVGVSTADFRAGEQIRVIDLLYGLLLQSACEAGNILADYYGGGNIQTFIDKMNTKAQELGATNTHFVNAHGLDAEGQVTTAKDMYLITKYALSLDHFEEISCTALYEAPATNIHTEPRYFVHTNLMMNEYRGGSYYYEPIKGIKTGTDGGVKNLVSMASKNGFNYLLVTLGAPDVDGDNLCFKDTKYLYEWAFNGFSYKTVLKSTETVGTTKIRLSSETDTLQLAPAEDLTLLLPNDVDISSVQQILNVPESVDAPVNKGDEIGTMQLKLNDEVIGETKVVAATSVSKNFIYGVWDVVTKVFGNIWVQLIAGAVVACILFYIIITILYNRKEKKRKQLTAQRKKRQK